MTLVTAVIAVIAVVVVTLGSFVDFILLALVAAPMIMMTVVLAFSSVIPIACFMLIPPIILVSPVGTILPACRSWRPLCVRVLGAVLTHVLGCHSSGVCIFSGPSGLMPLVLPAAIPCQNGICIRNCHRQ
jgi:hypothetical protein